MSACLFPPRRRGQFLYPGDEIRDVPGRDPRQAARVALDSPTKAAIEVGRTRLAVTAGVFVIAFLVIAVRLVNLMALSDGRAHETADAALPAAQAVVQRGDVLDRNGVVLATNLPTVNLYADARQVHDPDDTAARLVSVLPDIPFETARARLASGRSFVYLRRNLTPREQDLVNRLGLPGLEFEAAERRVFPQGRLAAHVLGATDVDNRGIAGIERAFDDRLGTDNRPLRLSLDIRVQHAVREVLAEAVDRFQALAGAAMVMDARTGELLALVSLPDYEPERFGAAPSEARFNRATLGVYEMGSTFKLVNTALGLEVGGYRLTDGFDASHPLRMAGFRIKDFHAQGRWLSIPEILVHSSNIGSGKMALSVGGERQKAFLDRLGLLSPVSIELPEAGVPLYPETWRPINTVTISYGHGIAVTPLHLVTATAALVNGGVLRAPTLLRRGSGAPPGGRRVLSVETSDKMRQLMRMVVEEGTGGKADVPGYLVGGKTGTAEKANGGGYRAKALLPSFVAAFPMDAPRYVVLAMLDEPKGLPETHGFATAGWNAAPTAGAIIARVAPLLGVTPRPAIDGPPDGVRLAVAGGGPGLGEGAIGGPPR
ncbi:peptidoglycan D,D-transpeptidase FtsI family protein [Roseospira visakhapatnamensis]|uniref:Cell division protein FtsI (Penicillin-binding protein 3) n=1 Tax=Roseospira visakhapatnamensis TaxID=390880 RepID=A0A7W6WAS9_9PROT|nr:penicillin-binding protein 2 [Roseospira visakhapatnamensis]MBB4267515.1 cell division protein FtsI (penicillin-binding protein 3) [Roseospira visakhapatnamensis]